MKIYIGNEKGGSGKTTLTLFLSLYIKHYYNEVKVAYFDSDTKQRAITRIMKLRKKNNLLYLGTCNNYEDFKKYEDRLIFIDGRANLNNEDSKYINDCDFVLVPSSTTFLDLQSTKDYITFLKENNIPFKVIFIGVEDKETIKQGFSYLGKDNCFKNYIKHNKRYSCISEKGETDLDSSFVNFHKWHIKKELELVVEELFNNIY